MAGRRRGLLAVLHLALVRCRARPGRWLPAAAGVAVACALLGAVAGLGVLAADRAAGRVLESVPPARRTVTLTWAGGVPRDVEVRARAALGRMTAAPAGAAGSAAGAASGAAGSAGGAAGAAGSAAGATAGAAAQTRTVLRRPALFDGRAVRLAAIRPLERWVRVEAGRTPQGCVPARCEVLQLGGARVPQVLADRGVRLVVVGRGRVTSPVPLGFVPAPPRPGAPRGARADPPVLASGDPAGLEAMPGLRTIPRVQSWTADLNLGALRVWALGTVLARLREEAAAAGLRDRGLTATAPVGELQTARARAAGVPGRLLGVAAPAAAALAAFLLGAAGGLRGGLRAELDRLARRGATRGQRAVLAVAECALPAVAGTLAGAAVAVGAVAAAGTAGDAGAAAALDHGLLRPGVVLGLVGGAALATALLVAGSCARRATGVRLAEGALVAAGAAGLALAVRGPVRAGADGAAVLLPVLAAVVAGLAVGRLAPAVLRAGGRLAPAGGGAPARLALLDLARRPGPAALAAGGLTVALGLAALAVATRDTLARGARDQAAFAVPLDASVTQGAAPGPGLAERDLRAWNALPGVASAAPVLRRDADAVQGPSFGPVTLLGIPEGALAGARAPAGAPAARGRAAPAPARSASPARAVRLRARVSGDAVRLALAVRRPDGVTRTVALGTAGRRARVLEAPLPPGVRGGEVRGLVVDRPAAASATTAHQTAEDGASGAAPRAVLHLGPLRDHRGRVVTRYAGWGGHGAVSGAARPAGGPSASRSAGGRARPAASGRVPATGAAALTVRVSFDRDGSGLLRPPAAIDRAPLAVVTDPGTARDAGRRRTVDLRVRGTTIPARIVGTAPRVPTVRTGGFAVAEAGALAAALDALRPGAGRPGELWVRARPGTPARELERTLAAGGGVTVRTRAAVLAALRADPLRRSLGGVLTAAACVALALALLGVGLATRRLVRDGAAELADLEADGTSPSALRRLVAIQGAATALLGAAGGACLAAALLALAPAVARAVTGGTAAVPPLRAGLPAGELVLLAGAALGAAGVLVAVLARGSFREPWPGRPGREEAA